MNDTVLSDPIETDLAVIGGGLSGLTAGVAATERGLSVHVFERGADERYPCNSRFAGGAFHVAYIDPTSDPDGLVDAINRVTKDEADPNLATVVAENAARTIYWLRDHGVDFSPGPTPMHKFMVTPHRPMLAGLDWPGHGPDEMIKTLTRKLLAAGGTLHRDAEALELLMDGAACKGMSVRIGKNDPIQVSAKSVLIADGGFQGNPNMVGKYIAKRPDLLVQRSAGTATGDGIRMAEAAGAELIFMERFYGHFLAREAMQREGRGVLLYMNQEGRGIGLHAKIQAYNLQDKGVDTVDANLMLGHPDDARDYQIAKTMLDAIGVKEVCLLSNNPDKVDQLAKYGVAVVDRLPLVVGVGDENRQYIATKVERMGHIIEMEDSD